MKESGLKLLLSLFRLAKARNTLPSILNCSTALAALVDKSWCFSKRCKLLEQSLEIQKNICLEIEGKSIQNWWWNVVITARLLFREKNCITYQFYFPFSYKVKLILRGSEIYENNDISSMWNLDERFILIDERTSKLCTRPKQLHLYQICHPQFNIYEVPIAVFHFHLFLRHRYITNLQNLWPAPRVGLRDQLVEHCSAGIKAVVGWNAIKICISGGLLFSTASQAYSILVNWHSG